MRLVGVSLSRLSHPDENQEISEAPVQRSLFDLDEKPKIRPSNEKARKLNQMLDQVAGRFGTGALKPASAVDHKNREEN